jgi:hypothetical protein
MTTGIEHRMTEVFLSIDLLMLIITPLHSPSLLTIGNAFPTLRTSFTYAKDLFRAGKAAVHR